MEKMDFNEDLNEEMKRSLLDIQQDLLKWEDIVVDLKEHLDQPSISHLKPSERTAII
jgi:hypothetical protein